jgi:hypothetical protein
MGMLSWRTCSYGEQSSSTVDTAPGRASVARQRARQASPQFEPLESRRMMSVVLPGTSQPVAVAGTSVAARPALAGTVIYDHTTPFDVVNPDFDTSISGEIRNQVVRERRSGTLDFYETISCDPSSIGAAFQLEITQTNFAGFSTDVGFRTDLGGNATLHPFSATRSAAPGSTVNLFFGGGAISPGQHSEPFFIKTNAKRFDVKGITDMSGESAGGLLVVPLPAPEPVIDPGSIAGTSFLDINADGKRQASEPALSGTTVFLDSNGDGKLEPGERSTTTNALGHYTFANLTPGTYHVAEVLRIGFRQSEPSTREYTVTVGQGQNLTGLNFGTTPIKAAKALIGSGSGASTTSQQLLSDEPLTQPPATAIATQMFADGNTSSILDGALNVVAAAA